MPPQLEESLSLVDAPHRIGQRIAFVFSRTDEFNSALQMKTGESSSRVKGFSKLPMDWCRVLPVYFGTMAAKVDRPGCQCEVRLQ
jgi:hypothetical protein